MLEVQELTKKYGKNVAVDHVSFMVQDGQVGILLGQMVPWKINHYKEYCRTPSL